ncbi:hypothetical protein [Deinococcus radiopugnans]|uniref:hypothetical protein n=1 Tax=Deinococcus radiopugnans TaxID=57497 RepID=UPI0012E055B9|nr:hypothetical protein [Deinococcus radiopugnans]
MVLELLGLGGKSISLVLDAEYKNYVPGHDALRRDLNKSARRYGRALGGAMAFLVHPGDKGNVPFEAWPSPTLQLHTRPPSPPFSTEDLPLRHGIVRAFPG